VKFAGGRLFILRVIEIYQQSCAPIAVGTACIADKGQAVVLIRAGKAG
jgi:hypothetical protein